MKYCRFLLKGQTHYGAVEDRGGEPWIVDLAPAPPEDLAFHLARARASKLVPDPSGMDFEPMALSSADLLPPVTPSKIVCVGRNYREHAAELGNRGSSRASAVLQAAFGAAQARRHNPPPAGFVARGS